MIWYTYSSLLKIIFIILSFTLLLLVTFYLFILTLLVSIWKANLLEETWFYPCRMPLEQLITKSITLAGILFFHCSICHHQFFFPIFRFVTNSQSPYHSLCIRKPISSCNPRKCWPPLPIPYSLFQENSFCLPDCPSHLQCRPAVAHLPKAAWKLLFCAAWKATERLLQISPLLWWSTQFILHLSLDICLYPLILFFLPLCEWGVCCLFFNTVYTESNCSSWCRITCLYIL